MPATEELLQEIIQHYDLPGEQLQILPLEKGLINHTWKVSRSQGEYILQKINTHIFKSPESIAYNIKNIGTYLTRHHPRYFFVRPVPDRNGNEMIHEQEGYYRLFPYVTDSRTLDVLQSPQQAFEAARQFGLFTFHCQGFPVDTLKITLEDFHNLTLRYQQFSQALASGVPERIRESKDLIDYMVSQRSIVDIYESIKANPAFQVRVTHHDTKISNVLFNSRGKGLCVIDLDTVMPGYFISDVGDMIRTYLSPVSEEEGDLSKIVIREEFFLAVWKGYIGAMEDLLSQEEKEFFLYSGKFMIYMQALRFLTDYLNGDSYYKITYKDQNLLRTRNQITLLQQLLYKEPALKALIST